MKRFVLIVAFSILFLFSTSLQRAAAQAPAPAPERREFYQGLALCLPDAYPQEPADCVPAGPSATLTQWNQMGLSIPAQPLPVRPLPTGLGTVPFQYLLASDKSVPVFSSLDDATANNPRRTIPAGRVFLAYKQRVENESGVYYQFQTGEWIRGESVLSRVGYSSESRGVLLTGVPRTDFAWLIDPVETLSAPGVQGKPTGHKLPVYSVVPVYDTRKVDGYAWTMIGVNEWVEDRLVAKVDYNPTPPKGVTNGRWVEINIGRQTVSIYENNRLIFAALAATGIQKLATRPGIFQVDKKVAAEHMTTSNVGDPNDFYYLESVPWTVYFDEGRAMHGIYWRTNLGRPASHGCVNLTVADSRWLFDWVKVGDTVYAWDGVNPVLGN
jgi:lipoprotein-anchoring transpeptidase ErfK/SrfK